MQTVLSEKLFELISSLDRSQVWRIEKEFKREGKTLSTRLYRRFRKVIRWGEGSEEFVKGHELRNTGQYWRTKKQLAGRIVEILMPQDSSLPGVDFIRTAIHMDLLPIARDRALREIDLAIERTDESYLNLLLGSLNEFETHYRVDFKLSPEIPHWREVHQGISIKKRLLEMLDEIRRAFKQNNEKRASVADDLEEDLKRMENAELEVEHKKVWVGICLLRGQTDQAIKFQKRMIEMMEEDWTHYPLPMIGTEITIYIRFMMFTHNHKEAIRYTELLSSLPKGSPIENRINKNLSLSTQIVVSEFLANLEMAEKSGPELLKTSNLNPAVFAGMIFRIAVCYFYHEMIVYAEKWMGEFSKIPIKNTSELDWEFKIFSAMIQLENNNRVLAESFLKSAYRKGRKNNSKYQQMASETIGCMISQRDPLSELPNRLLELDKALESLKEKRSAWLIDIRPYLESKIGRGNMPDLVRKSRRIPYTINILGMAH